MSVSILEKREIRFSDGEVKLMTYDEVLKQFSDMINKFAYEIVSNSIYNEILEKDDVKQELLIGLWKAYLQYDVNAKTAFSTYLHHKLMGKRSTVVSKVTAKKRVNESGTLSMNASVLEDGGESELENSLGYEDDSIAAVEFSEFIKGVNQSLNKEDRLCLRVLMDKKSYSVNDLSEDLGMTRQGAAKKVNVFKEKMKNILVETGYLESNNLSYLVEKK